MTTLRLMAAVTWVLLYCWLVPLPAAEGAACGPGQPNPTCLCGDTVVGAYTMPANLVCPTGHGLRVAFGSNLNCNNRTITGAGLPETYGIYIDHAIGATARQCTVVGFDRGVRINGGSDHLIKNVVSAFNGDPVLHTGYGIDLAGGTTGNTLNMVSVYGNYDEGIHFGSNASLNTLKQSQVCGNFRENVYLLDGVANLIRDSTMGHDCFGLISGGNSAYIKDSVHVHFLNNVFNKVQVHVTGASKGTVFYNNVFNAAYKESCIGADCPTDTIRVP